MYLMFILFWSPLLWLRKRFTVLSIATVMMLNLVYLISPFGYETRFYWGPFVEEFLKSSYIKSQKMETHQPRLITAACYGVVDAFTRIPQVLKSSQFQAATADYPTLLVGLNLILGLLPIILLHLIYALFYRPTTERFFWLGPLVAHLMWNATSLHFLGSC